MVRYLRTPFLSLALIFLVAGATYCEAQQDVKYQPLSEWELVELVQPVALFPDVLLKAMLPASTFPDQIVDAFLLVKSKADAPKIKDQHWDDSVKVVATYPGVLKMLFDDLAWTDRLGNAYLYQHQALLDAFQDVRKKAQQNGQLKSNQYQTVSSETTPAGEPVVVVQPTNPEVVYVPQDTVVYSGGGYYEPSPMVPMASFGLGMALGAAIADDDDDDYYYGGGPVYWHDDDHFEKWADNRREVWEDYNDRRWDQQEYRQGARDDRREFRQDAISEGTAGSGQYAAQRRDQAAQRAGTLRENNPEVAARADNRQVNRAAQGSQVGAAAQKRGTYSRASGSGFTAPPSSNGYRGSQVAGTGRTGSSGAFQGYNSGGRTMAASNRGSVSRSTSGSYGGSRPTYSGGSRGGFSGAGRSGGFSGGGRGGGGRGGRR